MLDLAQFQGSRRERMLWGTYRPHLYFGVRARRASRGRENLVFFLEHCDQHKRELRLWSTLSRNGAGCAAPHRVMELRPAIDGPGLTKRHRAGGIVVPSGRPSRCLADGGLSLRHTCEESDRLARYGWLRHNGESFGRQEILDDQRLITTSFVKSFEPGAGYGGSWAARFEVTEPSSSKEEYSDPLRKAVAIFYMVDEGGGELAPPREMPLASGSVVASGSDKTVGEWELTLHVQSWADVSWVGLQTAHMHNITDLMMQVYIQQFRERQIVELPNSSMHHPNLIAIQVSAKPPLQVDFSFVSGLKIFRGSSRAHQLAGEKLSAMLKQEEDKFDSKFERIFSFPAEVDSTDKDIAKAALSNLLGGIGYFYGRSRIQATARSGAESKIQLYWPAPLYTAVPSRSFFPRGFLWDEGFHQLLIRKWDKGIHHDVVAHWLDLMNCQGWIPREQILGQEARSKVPSEFVVQRTSNANPPTLFLSFQELAMEVERGEGTADDVEFLRSSFPRLKAWYNWFNSSNPGSFYWHGRDQDTEAELNPKTLTSGLDDYPRASHPSHDERHLDLRCWMALASECMFRIARIIKEPSHEYEKNLIQLSQMEALDKLHLDAASGRYYDFGNHTEQVKLVSTEEGHWVRQVLGRPRPRLVPQFGYNSLFPLLMRLLPSSSDRLGQQLELLRVETLLSLYMKYNTQHDGPYWRGPVWININFMTLSSLHFYSRAQGPHQEIAARLYTELRQNVMRNVLAEYRASGYLWEQYDNANSGKGKGSHPFTGWTSLLVLIMAESYHVLLNLLGDLIFGIDGEIAAPTALANQVLREALAATLQLLAQRPRNRAHGIGDRGHGLTGGSAEVHAGRRVGARGLLRGLPGHVVRLLLQMLRRAAGVLVPRAGVTPEEALRAAPRVLHELLRALHRALGRELLDDALLALLVGAGVRALAQHLDELRLGRDADVLRVAVAAHHVLLQLLPQVLALVHPALVLAQLLRLGAAAAPAAGHQGPRERRAADQRPGKGGRPGG
eukprot:SM000008S22316  [mRNA]  locus=s8:1007219:1015250:+ [translate_table: standard]